MTKIRFKQGETVRFRVRADVADEVHVHGYDLMKDIEPGKTIEFSFPADITGIFEIELESAGEQIGQLRRRPGVARVAQSCYKVRLVARMGPSPGHGRQTPRDRALGARSRARR